jgi:transcription initiation factor TFIID TATA-box-binding protein
MTKKESVEVQNIVGSGKLKPELDLAAVAEDLQDQDGIDEVEHSRRSGNRLLIYFSENDGLGILAPTAVYIFNGVDNYEDLENAKTKLLTGLAELGIISSPTPPESQIVDPFEIQNVVCTGDLNKELNLEAFSIALGIENVEYEPEQFPGLVYKPKEFESTALLFASGKVVVMGVADEKLAQEVFDSIKNKVTELFG